MNNTSLLLAMQFSDYMNELLITLKITLLSTAIAYVFGLAIGVCLFITKRGGLLQNRIVNTVLGLIVNVLRSVPFVILLVLTQPIAKFLTGSKMLDDAFIVYLTLSAIPFVARLCENSFNEVNGGIIESAVSMGASKLQIIFKVLLPESKPSLLLGLAIALVTVLGYTPMSYLVGGGGLGSMAVSYGLYKFDKTTMYIASLVLIVLVQIIQIGCAKLAQKWDKRKKI